NFLDIYLLEAVVNGILLGGLLALLALGLNLVFGVIDVIWICYAELVMFGMYGMYYLGGVFGLPFPLAALLTILGVALMGATLHYLVIAPLLAPRPINHLPPTAGVPFFLQTLPTSPSGIVFRNSAPPIPPLASAAVSVPD